MKLNLYSYSSYSDFINDWHVQRQKQDHHWSLGKFSRCLGLGNTAAITNIIKGRKVPARSTVIKLTDFFEFNEREKKYFQGLVELARNNDNSLLESSLRRMMSFLKPKEDHKEISSSLFKTIARPSFFALREMVKLKEFELNYKEIKNRLNIAISEAEIQRSFETLIKVGLLNNNNGKLTQSVDFYETTNDIPSIDIRDFHKEALKQAANLIDVVDVKHRHYSSDTIVLNKENIEHLKALLDNFRKEVTTQFDQSSGDVVYQFNLQLVPLTKVEE